MVVVAAAASAVGGVEHTLRARPLQAPPRPLHHAKTLTLAASSAAAAAAAVRSAPAATTNPGQKIIIPWRKQKSKNKSSDQNPIEAARYRTGAAGGKLGWIERAGREICALSVG